jgi:beta-xylosidase
MLDEVKFGNDGWPTINDGKGPSVRTLSPFGAPQKKNDARFSDDFSGAELRPAWQWPQDREPVYRVGNGQLVLRANSDTNLLSTVLARAVTAEDYVATVAVENGKLTPGWAGGLWAYGDGDNSVGLASSRDSVVLLRQHKGVWKELGRQTVAGATVHLRMQARHGWQYQFSISEDGKKWAVIDKESDARDLPPWDRSVRVALTAGGAADAEVQFEAFSMEPVAQ